jgi:hypothetical protein
MIKKRTLPRQHIENKLSKVSVLLHLLYKDYSLSRGACGGWSEMSMALAVVGEVLRGEMSFTWRAIQLYNVSRSYNKA